MTDHEVRKHFQMSDFTTFRGQHRITSDDMYLDTLVNIPQLLVIRVVRIVRVDRPINPLLRGWDQNIHS